MANDDWRIRIEVEEEEHATGLLDRLAGDLGSDEARELAKDLEARKLAVSRDGETVFVRWVLTGHHTGTAFSGIERTGAAIELDGMDQFTIRDGKVASNFVVFDQMEVGRQLGLLPPDGSAADRALKVAFNAKTKVTDAIRNARS